MIDAERPAVFRAHPAYRWMAIASAGVALLLMWELRQGWMWGAALAAVVALGVAGYMGRLALCRVDLSETHLRLHRPFASPRTAERRQIVDVYVEGRWLRSALLLYHPRHSDGLVDGGSPPAKGDHEDVRLMVLPAVQGQDRLLDALGGETGQRPSR